MCGFDEEDRDDAQSSGWEKETQQIPMRSCCTDQVQSTVRRHAHLCVDFDVVVAEVASPSDAITWAGSHIQLQADRHF